MSFKIKNALKYGYIMFSSTNPKGKDDDYSSEEVMDVLEDIGIQFEYVMGINDDNEYFDLYFIPTIFVNKAVTEELVKTIEALGQEWYYRSLSGLVHEIVSVDGKILFLSETVQFPESMMVEKNYFCTTDANMTYFTFDFKPYARRDG